VIDDPLIYNLAPPNCVASISKMYHDNARQPRFAPANLETQARRDLPRHLGNGRPSQPKRRFGYGTAGNSVHCPVVGSMSHAVRSAGSGSLFSTPATISSPLRNAPSDVEPTDILTAEYCSSAEIANAEPGATATP
jgi:hypothetical protein